jgi:hypothetical protein
MRENNPGIAFERCRCDPSRELYFMPTGAVYNRTDPGVMVIVALMSARGTGAAQRCGIRIGPHKSKDTSAVRGMLPHKQRGHGLSFPRR